MHTTGLKALRLALIAAVMFAIGQEAVAQDKVKVGVFPTASSLPYFVAIERGFFKEQNIEPETIRLIGGPPNIAAMISNQIEAAVVLVTIEAMNANLKKPGVAMYIGVHSQNKTYQMEQFVVRKGYAANFIKDLKGARIMSAPGPANVVAAKAVLAKVGLKEGDYSIDQLDMGQHVNVMTSGTFDAGYTLEPQASTMRKLGVARTLEAGVIAKYILDDENGDAFAAGCAITSGLHPEPSRCLQAFCGGMEKGHPLRQRRSAGSAQIPCQEHAHSRGRGRYRADGALLRSRRVERAAQGRVSSNSSTSSRRLALCRREWTSPDICRRLKGLMIHPQFSEAASHISAAGICDALVELVNIASPTGQEAGVAGYLVDRMQKAGLDTEFQFVDPGRPNAVGHLRGQGTGLKSSLHRPYGSSYSGEEEHLAGEEFKPRAVVRDGWVWGLGAHNMKSGLACALIAIEAIVKAGIRLQGDISLGAVVGEIEKTAVEGGAVRNVVGICVSQSPAM